MGRYQFFKIDAISVYFNWKYQRHR